MPMVKKVFVGVCLALIFPLTLSAVVGYSMKNTLGNPDYIKQTITEAELSKAISKQIKSDLKKDKSSDTPKELQKVIDSAIKEQNIDAVIGSSIDATFKVLNGEVEIDKLQIDISPISTTVRKQLTTEVKKQYPIATDKQIQSEVNKTLKETGILDKNTITLDDLAGIGEEQPKTKKARAEQQQKIQDIKTSANNATALYQAATWLWPVSAILALLCVAGAILLSEPMYKGIKMSGIIVGLSGFILTIASIIGNNAVKTVLEANQKGADALSLAGQKVGQTFTSDILGFAQTTGLVLAVLGAIMGVAGYFLCKKYAAANPTQKPKPIAKPTPRPKK